MSFDNQKFIDLSRSFINALGGENRAAYFEDFLVDGIPNNKLEQWKYSNLASLLENNLGPLESSKSSDLKEFPMFEHENVIVFYNGELILDAMKLDSSLNVSLTDKEYTNEARPALVNLNQAMTPKTVTLKLKKECSLSSPLYIYHFYDKENALYNDSFELEVGPMSKAIVIENFETTVSGKMWVNSLNQFKVNESANLEYISIYKGSDHLIHTANVKSTILKDASFNSFSFNMGSLLGRIDYTIDLNETGADAKVNGLYPLCKKLKADHYTVINHNDSHTNSSQLFKGLLTDESRGIFNGKVNVIKDAQQVNSDQLNKNVLLSKKAHVNTLPTLLVAADDVKCAHGATVGQLNEEELFYLQSRGVDKVRAFKMLCAGFSQDVINHIDSIPARKIVQNIMEERFALFEKDIEDVQKS